MLGLETPHRIIQRINKATRKQIVGDRSKESVQDHWHSQNAERHLLSLICTSYFSSKTILGAVLHNSSNPLLAVNGTSCQDWRTPHCSVNAPIYDRGYEVLGRDSRCFLWCSLAWIQY